MAEQIGNDNDGVLLLELGISSDQSEFDKARKSLEDLRNSMQDIDIDFSLGPTLDSLRTALNLVKSIASIWNSLQSKALDISYSTQDNVLYNISEATRRNIEYSTSHSEIAKRVGVTSDTMLADLKAISLKQGETKRLGKLNDEDWIAVTQLAQLMGDERFQGNRLQSMLLDESPSNVYLAFGDLLSNAYRRLETLPDNSKTRADLLTYIQNFLATPYMNYDVGRLLSILTKKENPTYGKSGNPLYTYIGGGLEEFLPYMEAFNSLTAGNIDLSEDMGALDTEVEKATDKLWSWLYKWGATTVVKPFKQNVSDIAQILSGNRKYNAKKLEFSENSWMDNGIRGWSKMKAILGEDEKYRYADLAGHFGLSAGWVERDKTLGYRLAGYGKDIGTNRISDPIAAELGFYELMRLSQASYETDARSAITYAIGKLQNQSAFSYTHKKGTKTIKGTFDTYEDSMTAIQNAMLNPVSPYYIGTEGGFLDIYTMLYKTGSLGDTRAENAKAYLELMANVFKNTEIDKISNFTGLEMLGQDITGAKVVEYGGKGTGDWRLEIVVTDTVTGKQSSPQYLKVQELIDKTAKINYSEEEVKSIY